MWWQGECLPETLDWFGYDYYCTIPGCVGAYSYMSGWQVQMDGAHPDPRHFLRILRACLAC